MKFLRIFPLPILLAAPAFASSESAAPARNLLSSLPLLFEPAGRDHSAFVARTPGAFFSLNAGEARLRFPDSGRQLVLSFPGSRRDARIEGLDPLRSRSHYLLGNRRDEWRTAPHFSRVRTVGLWPGINLIFYGNASNLEYDFVVEPGADPRRIRLSFGGAALSLDSGGALKAGLGGRSVLQKPPVAFQTLPGGERRAVQSRYRLVAGGQVAIDLGPYDRTLPLVVDPVLVYGSLLGTSASDAITAVRASRDGMIYATGYVDSDGIAAPERAFRTEPGGGRDVFLAKINPAVQGPGALEYFTYIGGSGLDTATALALDSSGGVYIAGYTESDNFPLAGNTPRNQLTGDGTGRRDAFVMRLNPALAGQEALLYSTLLGGDLIDAAYGVDVDTAGNIYVCGVTRSENFPVTSGVVQNARWGDQDGFIAKLHPDRQTTLIYSSFLGGENAEECRALTLDSNGLVYLTGGTFSPTFPLAGAPWQPTNRGNGDVFVTVLDLNRAGFDALVYSTYLGGTAYDDARSIALDPAGAILVAGFTLSPDFPTTASAHQRELGGNADAFVARFAISQASGEALTYSSYTGGSGGDVAYAVAADASGRIYMAGYTVSGNFPVTPDAFQPAQSGGIDVFLSAFNPAATVPSGTLVFSTFIGKGGRNSASALAILPSGAICVAGYASDLQFPVTEGSIQESYTGGLSDGFLLLIRN